MSVLKNMVRLHRWAVDEKRQKLANLEGLRDKMQSELEELEREVEREKEVAGVSPDSGYAYPAFVAAALERRRKMAASIAEIERSIDAAREELQEAFQAVKKYETALEMHERRERHKREVREQFALDQQGLEMHRRKASAAE